MAPNILKELKGVNFSCASPASTSIDQQQYSLRMSLGSTGRAIDRFSPHLRDPLRAKSLNPELTTHHNKPKLGSGSQKTTHKKAKEKAPAQQLVSPASSSRFLLSGSASDDLLHSEAATSAEAWRSNCIGQPATKALGSAVAKAVEPSRFRSAKVEQSSATTTSHDHESSSSFSSFGGSSARPQNHQVVVLRVSLHCKGCEGKVRKHLSKMEGVTSFTTDLSNKKVTVVGDVTPLGVLNSISKVKNAQLWRSLPPAST